MIIFIFKKDQEYNDTDNRHWYHLDEWMKNDVDFEQFNSKINRVCVCVNAQMNLINTYKRVWLDSKMCKHMHSNWSEIKSKERSRESERHTK